MNDLVFRNSEERNDRRVQWPERSQAKKDELPSLRPPTLMIDLLFGALMLFAFQMGDPNSSSVIPRNFELPTANDKATRKKVNLLALKPIREGRKKWVYEMPDGRRMTAEKIVRSIREDNRTPVLLVPSDAQVQNYIDAEQPLRRLGIKAGLAVEIKKGNTP